MSTITGTFSYEGKNEYDWYEGEIDGTECSTKVEAIGKKMAALDGQEVTAELKVQQKGKYTNRYVESIERADGEAVEVKEEKAAPVPPRAEKPDGSPDWDMKGLHMSRNALWKAYLSGDAITALMAWWTRNNSEKGEAELLNFLRRVGVHLVTAAEYDQYNREVATEEDLIPFG